MSNSLANEFRPKHFHQYQGQGKDKGGTVDYFTTAISLNKHPSAVLITGSPGVGKTSLAKLYCKATLCKNRLEGEFEACGECDICTGKDTTNINEYTVAQATDFKDAIEEIKEIITSLPVGIPSRPDQYRRFMLLDEIQLASKQALASFLNTLEFSPPTTTVILVSMDFDKLDPTVKEAIESRCVEHSLSTFKPFEIAQTLSNSNPSLNYEAAFTIAKFSNGNMRRAWQILQSFDNFNTEDLTSSIVYKRKAGGADDSSRQLLWQALKEGNLDSLRNIFNSWSSSSEDIIAHLLIDDIINTNSVFPATLSFLSSIAGWLKTTHRPPLLSLLMLFLNANVLSTKEHIASIVEVQPILSLSDLENEACSNIQQIEENINKEVVKDISILPIGESISSNLELNVLSKITKASSNKLNIPALFLMNRFAEIYKYYS